MNLSSKLAHSRLQRVLPVGLWCAAAVAGINDLVHVHNTWWFGSDFQPTVLSVSALFHNHAIVSSYVYPPGLLVLSWPLLLLQHGRRAEDLLLIVLVAGFAYTFLTMARLPIKQLSGSAVAGLALAIACSGQLVFALQLENLTLLLLPFVAAFYSLVARRHWLAAGLVLGISLTIKPMLIPLVILLLLERRWKAAVTAIGVPILTSAIALAVSYQPSHFAHALRGLLSGSGAGGSIGLSGIGGIWRIDGVLVGGARILIVLLTILIVRRIWTSSRPTVTRHVWIGETMIACLLLASQFTHTFYALLLLPAAFVGLTEVRALTRGSMFVGIGLVLIPYELAGIGQWPAGNRMQSTLICVGMLLILGAAATIADQDETSRPPGSRLRGLSAVDRESVRSGDPVGAERATSQ